MGTKTKRGRQTFYSGPFKGVFATRDPYDAETGLLVDAKNGYVADPTNGSGWYGRPGFRQLFNGSPLIAPGTAFRGQAIYNHVQLDGSVINFLVAGGKIFRVDSTLSTKTDVTPVGVTIDGAITTRVFFATLIGTLMATDGVHRPWIATNLTTTPITGTYIDYDGMGVDWTMYGAPRVYGGSAFGILNQVNSVSRREDISWCEPGTLATGWQQAGYDNNWTLSQNEAGLLYALEADNAALRYFRGGSIGAVTGPVGPNLASTATDDAVAFNIGAQASQTIQKFGNGFFFLDALGRPYWYQPGIAPDPIWKQMRSFIEEGSANFPTTTAIVSTAVLEPTLNLYIVGIYSPTPSTQAPVVELHVFDAQTRLYQGRWSLRDEDGVAIGIDCIGTLVDSAGRATLIALTEGGYVWAFSALASTPEELSTEAGVLLTTQAGLFITTEGDSQQWTDNGVDPEMYAMTDRLGYDDTITWNVDSCTAITLGPGQLSMSVETSAVAQTIQAKPTPSPSQDGTYRLFGGFDVQGRGPQVTIAPLEFTDQFVLERVSIVAIPSLAGPEDS